MNRTNVGGVDRMARILLGAGLVGAGLCSLGDRKPGRGAALIAAGAVELSTAAARSTSISARISAPTSFSVSRKVSIARSCRGENMSAQVGIP